MSTFNLEAYGVVEASREEMVAINGGSRLRLVRKAAAWIVGLFTAYEIGKEVHDLVTDDVVCNCPCYC